MPGTDTAADVPGKYDVIVDGYGYLLLRTVDTSLPFRTQRALYSRSPTFVERQNVSNAYGDNAQDFFLTVRQRDWSQGEQQKYFRSGQDGRYWLGTNVDTRTPGQVTIRQAVSSVSFAAAPTSIATYDNSNLAVVTSTNLYLCNYAGSISDKGAHGLGSAPSSVIALDSVAFITGEAAGTVGIRKYAGGAFSTWSATAGAELAYLNNTLYGLATAAGPIPYSILRVWTSGGLASTAFEWKRPDGTDRSAQMGKMVSFGGKLLVMLTYESGTELWLWDGTSASILARLPLSFYGARIEVNYGIAFVSGVFVEKDDGTNLTVRPGVYFYDQSQVGLLWQASTTLTTTGKTQDDLSPAMAAYGSGLVFSDDTAGAFMFYNPALGGVSTIGTYTVAGTAPRMASTQRSFLHTRAQTTTYLFPNASSVASTASVTSSLIDFDSSLPKQFRGVKLDFEAASDGDGGSVDISYQVDSLSGSFTSLRTSAVSGTEYTFSNISGHAIAIKVTLNKGTSTAGPTLKDINVRAAPVLQSYNLRDFILDCSGRDGNSPVLRNDDSPHPLDGLAMVTNLNTAIASTTPVQVSDRFGTYTMVTEPDQCEIIEIRPEEFIARIRLREI